MTRFTLAANNGEIGGGEVMLLRTAKVLRQLGHEVTVVAPAIADGVGAAAAKAGFATVAIKGQGRKAYMRNLRAWDASQRQGVLWCHGHVPALATVGHPQRIVHLHQAPSFKHVVSGRLAACGALALAVPSASMAKHFPTAQIVYNWCEEVKTEPKGELKAPITVGFLGRPSPDKGIEVLAEAMAQLNATRGNAFELVVAGEPHFVDAAERERVSAALAPIASFTKQLGWTKREDFFNLVDLAVFPSICPESFGLMRR